MATTANAIARLEGRSRASQPARSLDQFARAVYQPHLLHGPALGVEQYWVADKDSDALRTRYRHVHPVAAEEEVDASGSELWRAGRQ
jgi:hypothetical protein